MAPTTFRSSNTTPLEPPAPPSAEGVVAPDHNPASSKVDRPSWARPADEKEPRTKPLPKYIRTAPWHLPADTKPPASSSGKKARNRGRPRRGRRRGRDKKEQEEEEEENPTEDDRQDAAGGGEPPQPPPPAAAMSDRAVYRTSKGSYDSVPWLDHGRGYSSDEDGDGPFEGLPLAGVAPHQVAVVFAAVGLLHVGTKTVKKIEEGIDYVSEATARQSAGWINFVLGFVACSFLMVFTYLLVFSVIRFGRRFRSDTAGDGPAPGTAQNRTSSTHAGTRTAISEARARAATLIRGEPRPAIEARPFPIRTSSKSKKDRIQPPEVAAQAAPTGSEVRAVAVGPTTQPQTKEVGCVSGAFRFLPGRRTETAAPAASSSTDVVDSGQSALRLAQEASDLRSRARDLQNREEDLAASYERLEAQRDKLRDREASLNTLSLALEAREERVRNWESEMNFNPDLRFGSMIALMPANDTLRTWVRLIESAVRLVCVIFYTFDLDILCTALEAAAKRGVTVRMLGDRQRVRQTKGTQAILTRLSQKRITVKLRDGEPLSAHYTAGVQSRLVETKQGQVHSKFLLADRNLVMGSTNFTTASQCNVETSAHVKLTTGGEEEVQAFFDNLYESAEAF